MPPFGKPEPATTQKLRIVPRQPGDTTSLSPASTEALRKAGMDPDTFTVGPGDPVAAALSGLPPAGSSLERSFLFSDRADALRCVETFADRGRPVSITKADGGWTVAINGSDDAGIEDAEEHRRIAGEATAQGGADRGFTRATVTTRVRVT